MSIDNQTNAHSEARRLAAIMFTDMVGYSAISQKNESLALELLEEQRRIVRSALTAHGGREIKNAGDGFLLLFDSALAAVRCAKEIQKAIVQANAAAPTERRFQLRVGIHLADVVLRDGDLFGDGVNIASRIEPLARPGGICLTGAVAGQIRNKIPEQLGKLEPAGLKNIDLHGARLALARARNLDPAYLQVHEEIGTFLFCEMNRRNEGIAEVEEAVRLNPAPRQLATLGRMYGLTGRRSDAMRILKLLNARWKTRTVQAGWIARVYDGIGDMTLVDTWMARAIQARESDLVYARLDQRRWHEQDNPQWTRLLKKIGPDKQRGD